MPLKEALKCFSCFEVSRLCSRVLSELKRVFGVDVTELLSPYSELLLCSGLFTEVYLVSSDLLGVVNVLRRSGRVPYCVGIYVGRFRGRKPYLIPSTMLANIVFSRLGRYVSTVVVSDEGLKPFLYGRDVLKASVTKVYPKLRRKDIAFVVGSDGYVYGVGISLVDDSTINDLGRNDVVIKNVFDVGWYLRGGTEPREKKFKT